MIKKGLGCFVLLVVLLMVLLCLPFGAIGAFDDPTSTPTDSSTFCHPGAYEGGAYLCPTTAPNTDETSVPYATPTKIATSTPGSYTYPPPEPTQDAYPAPEDPYPAPINPYPPTGGEDERNFEQGYPRPEPAYLADAEDVIVPPAEIERGSESMWDWFVNNVLKLFVHPKKAKP